jgi:hypothetical protein
MCATHDGGEVDATVPYKNWGCYYFELVLEFGLEWRRVSLYHRRWKQRCDFKACEYQVQARHRIHRLTCTRGDNRSQAAFHHCHYTAVTTFATMDCRELTHVCDGTG